MTSEDDNGMLVSKMFFLGDSVRYYFVNHLIYVKDRAIDLGKVRHSLIINYGKEFNSQISGDVMKVTSPNALPATDIYLPLLNEEIFESSSFFDLDVTERRELLTKFYLFVEFPPSTRSNIVFLEKFSKVFPRDDITVVFVDLGRRFAFTDLKRKNDIDLTEEYKKLGFTVVNVEKDNFEKLFWHYGCTRNKSSRILRYHVEKLRERANKYLIYDIEEIIECLPSNGILSLSKKKRICSYANKMNTITNTWSKYCDEAEKVLFDGEKKGIAPFLDLYEIILCSELDFIDKDIVTSNLLKDLRIDFTKIRHGNAIGRRNNRKFKNENEYRKVIHDSKIAALFLKEYEKFIRNGIRRKIQENILSLCDKIEERIR